MDTKLPASHPATAQALRTAEQHGGSLGMSIEEAEAHLAERGITRRPGSALAQYTAPARMEVDYRQIDMVGVHGVTPGEVAATVDDARVLATALQLDPVTAAAIGRDIAGAGDQDEAAVKRAVGADQYDAMIADVDAMLAGAKIPAAALTAATLSPHTLVQLAVIARFRAAKEAK